MNILFVGPNSGTSGHRMQAFRRLGHTVYNLNPDRLTPKHPVLSKLDWESGGLFSQGYVTRKALQELAGKQFGFTWVEGGRCVGPRLVEALRRFGPVVNYNHDDPFGKRDRISWLLYRKAVASYDFIVVVREPNIDEGRKAGAKRVLLRTRLADEVAHARRVLTPEDHARWDSEVCFVGTWFRGRGRFMADLVRRGVPLTLYGNRWQKAPEWPVIAKAWKGPGTTNDDDYARAIQCAKISLGLLSKENRDLHTTRSLEIPAIGGLFCAERTAEHERLYQDGVEAYFWRDATECAEICHRLLANEAERQETARRGHERCLANAHYNEALLAEILSEALCS